MHLISIVSEGLNQILSLYQRKIILDNNRAAIPPFALWQMTVALICNTCPNL